MSETNYDINTPKGMANSVQWTRKLLGQLKEGGVWIVPRSGTKVTVLNYAARRCRIEDGFASDIVIKKVIRASGWLIEGEKE